MKPSLELLIEDIKFDIIEIENTSESDFKKVYEIYTKLYDRFENLKEESFSSNDKFERFESYKKMYRNSGLNIENGIKNGLYTEHNFFQIKEDLKLLSTYLTILQ